MSRSMDQSCESPRENEDLFSRLLTTLNTWWLTATYPSPARGKASSFTTQVRYLERSRRESHWGIRSKLEGTRGSHAELKGHTSKRFSSVITVELGRAARLAARIRSNWSKEWLLHSDVLIQDHAHAYEDVSRPVRMQGPTSGGKIRIGEGCRIGRGAAILSGRGELVIGKNSVVAPDAVVMTSFPPNSAISGNPARAMPLPGDAKHFVAKDAAGRAR